MIDGLFEGDGRPDTLLLELGSLGLVMGGGEGVIERRSFRCSRFRGVE